MTFHPKGFVSNKRSTCTLILDMWHALSLLPRFCYIFLVRAMSKVLSFFLTEKTENLNLQVLWQMSMTEIMARPFSTPLVSGATKLLALRTSTFEI